MSDRNNLTRAALSVASGLALGMAFPKFDFELLSWVAFVPLFAAIEGESSARVFGWAWLAGFASYAASMYWIPVPLNSFAGVAMWLAIGPLVLLASVLAIYSATAIWAGDFASRRLNLSPALTMPIAWAAVEWMHTYFPIGFPWNLVGYTAYKSLAIIQFAEFTGVYGISALIVFFNAVVYRVMVRRASSRTQIIELSALTATMTAVLIFGTWRISNLRGREPTGELKVAMVQGNIPQSLKWDPNFLPQSFKVYEDETASAARLGVDLVVWPEAAAAFLFQDDGVYPSEFAGDAAYRDTLLQTARNLGVPILFGAPSLGRLDGSLGFYNRAYLVSAQGGIAAHYDKVNLVPFGEYVPARVLLGKIVNRVVEGFGDMIPGTTQTLFDVRGARLAVLICYESIFPDFTRRAVKGGADVLINITNDAWYGESSAPYQSLAMAAMRSVETKTPMVRVANTGVSAIITPTGEILHRTPLFKRGTEIETVGWRPTRTVYTIAGDLFSEICLALTILALIAGWLIPRRDESAPRSKRDTAISRNGFH